MFDLKEFFPVEFKADATASSVTNTVRFDWRMVDHSLDSVDEGTIKHIFNTADMAKAVADYLNALFNEPVYLSEALSRVFFRELIVEPAGMLLVDKFIDLCASVIKKNVGRLKQLVQDVPINYLLFYGLFHTDETCLIDVPCGDLYFDAILEIAKERKSTANVFYLRSDQKPEYNGTLEFFADYLTSRRCFLSFGELESVYPASTLDNVFVDISPKEALENFCISMEKLKNGQSYSSSATMLLYRLVLRAVPEDRKRGVFVKASGVKPDDYRIYQLDFTLDGETLFTLSQDWENDDTQVLNAIKALESKYGKQLINPAIPAPLELWLPLQGVRLIDLILPSCSPDYE